MSSIDLELKIEGLKKAIAEHKDFELDYDGRVQLSNFDITNQQDLVEMIVEKVHKLFVEAEASEL